MHHASHPLALSSTQNLGPPSFILYKKAWRLYSVVEDLRHHAPLSTSLAFPQQPVATLVRVLVHLSRLQQQIAVF